MTKKILFLLTFLLTTLGGGNSAWAATEKFTLSTVTSGPSYDETQHGVHLVIDKGSSNSGFSNENGYRLCSYSGESIGASITITAPEGYAVTGLVLTSNSKGNSVNQMTGFTITGNSDWNPFTVGKATNYTWTNSSNTTNPITFTTKNSSTGDVYIASITVTYSKLPYSGTPYTWIFNYGESVWPNTTASMLTSTTNYWQEGWVGSKYGYVTKTALNNELVDGNGTKISETQGLKFTAEAGNIGTTLQYEVGLKNSASVTIPAKAGQKIAVHAYWPAETMTLEHATENTSNASTFMPSAGDKTYYFTATADNVTLQVNSSMVFIYSIAVTKTDIATIGVSGGSDTSKEVGSSAWSPIIVFRDGNNKILTMSAEEWASCTLTNSDGAVITVLKGNHSTSSGGDGRGSITVTPVAAGTSTVTISFPGSDRYNAKEGTITFTITKQAQTLSFAAPTTTFDYGQNAPENALTQTPATGGGEVSYSSSDTHVATVAADGTVTGHNAGSCTITATAAETTTYAQTSASYTLTVNATQSAPTITMYKNYDTSHEEGVADGANLTATFGDNVYVTGICNVSGPTVKYRSSNESVATVDGSGAVTTKKGGEVVITVYTDSYQGYPAASVSYNLQINPALFDFKFKPYDEGTINVGATITPQMTIPTLMLEDVISITASSSDPDVAAVPENLLSGSGYPYLDVSDGRIHRIKPVITGVAVGDATITVNFTSKNYTSSSATYKVHVVAAGTRNFNWADGSGTPTYTIYEGDYMMLPKITGNSNGNDNYSRGSNKKYVYEIKSGTTTMNTTNYRIHEGVPDIMVVEGGTEKTIGDNAIVFFAKGQGTTFPDTLMIYGKAAGEVTLRAKDPQNGLFCDATIKIIPTTTLRSDSTNYVKNMSFPYTWDFTGNFDMTDIAANPHYWVAHSDYYAAGDGFFNVDWADRTNNGSSANLYFKDFVAGNGDGTTTAGKYMPQFYGLQMMLQSSLYSPKIDRVHIKNYNDGNPGAPRFVISGGPTHLKLPKAPTQPDSYRIYMKIHTKGDTEVGHGLSTAPIKKYAVESGKYSTNCQLTANTDAIIFFDVDNTTSNNEGTIIYLSNTSIYWIATSTEAKRITQPENMPYPAATYCYGKDLDFSLSKDANNSTFGATSGSNLTAWYAAEENFDNATKTVTMTQITSPFSQDQGVFLKTATGTEGDYYMISKAENTTSPAAGTNVSSTNMLAPLMTSQAVSRFDKDGNGDITHTNFFLNYRYKNYDEHNIDGEAIGGYNYPYSWRFYRIHNTVTGSAKTAYLHVPGEQKEVSASARRANRASGDLDTSGAMVHIIFEGETNTTGISTVDNDSVSVDDDAWYTLQGVRVKVPTKGGIYIHNGRKVVVK